MEKFKKTHGWKSKRTKHRKLIKFVRKARREIYGPGELWTRLAVGALQHAYDISHGDSSWTPGVSALKNYYI